MGIIYRIRNRTTGKMYIGQTWESLVVRWGRHERKAFYGDTSCRYLYAAIRKYGADDFELSVLAHADAQVDLDNQERYWIQVLRTVDFGYNLKLGGSAGRHSAETRKRMSRTHRAHPNSGVFQKGHKPTLGNTGKIAWNRQFDPPLTPAQRQARYRAKIRLFAPLVGATI